MAVDRKSEQGSKEEIAKGMAEAGKDEVGKAGGGAALKGRRGHGADPGKVSQGMSEAGSGTRPTTRAPAAAQRAACADIRGQPRPDRNLAVAARCGPGGSCCDGFAAGRLRALTGSARPPRRAAGRPACRAAG